MIAIEIAYKLGLNPTMDCSPNDDNAYYQTPIHPMVAAALELKWVQANTHYRVHGEELTFEQYQMRYIQVYG